MAKFPVEISDTEGIIDGLNYVLSGPSGLGQNFAGFSSYEPAYLTGNFRTPFSQPTLRNLYVAAIGITDCYFVDDRTFIVNFSSTRPSAPFNPGDQIKLTGVSGDSYWDGRYSTIGILSCTTTSCYIRVSSPTTGIATGTGGTIELNIVDLDNSTDCNARVTVTGGTDRVFISGQVDQTVNYEVLSGPADMNVYIAVNRYIGFLNDDPVNPDYLFNLDGTVAEKQYSFTGLSGTGTLPLIETVFSTLLDQPKPGYYWYILELRYESPSGTVVPTSVGLGLRSLSSQVVKQ